MMQKLARFGRSWPELFAIILWQTQKWRNNVVFNNKGMDNALKANWIMKTWEEIKKAFETENMIMPTIGNYREVSLKWIPPEHGFVTLNVDESVDVRGGTTRGGKVLHDES